MSFYAPVVSTLGGLALVAVAGGLGLLGAVATPAGRGWLERTFLGYERHLVAWAWVPATVATVGSLYLSDVVGLLPCLFCWYQRIAMYPLVLVLAVALARGDAGVWRYALPLSVVGLLLAIYHVALQWNPALEVVSCDVGAPCSGRYLAVFGFITIPTMAGSVFLLISALLLALRVVEGADRPPVEGSEAQPSAGAPVGAGPR